MSRFRELIEKCLKEYNEDDPGDKTWVNRSEWVNYYNQKKKERSYKPEDLVRVVCLSKNMYDDSLIQKLYIKEPRNNFDKTSEKEKAKIFYRSEAENYIKNHPEKVYPEENLRVIHEIEPA